MISEHLSADGFAAAVASRLNSVVPEGLAVRARGHVIGVCDPEWRGGSAIADVVATDDGRSIVERLETAARAILNSTQEAVMETTKEQWPVGAAGLGEPDARVVGNHLHLWFGEEAAPVLWLQPVDLTDLK